MSSHFVIPGVAAALRLAVLSTFLVTVVFGHRDAGTSKALEIFGDGSFVFPATTISQSFLESHPESRIGTDRGVSFFGRFGRKRSPTPEQQEESRRELSQRVAEAAQRLEALRADRTRRAQERRRRQAPPVAPPPPPVSVSDDIRQCLQILQTRLPVDEAYFCVSGREQQCRETMRAILRDGSFKVMRLAPLKAILERDQRRVQVSILLLDPENVRQLALLAPFMTESQFCGAAFDDIDLLNTAVRDVSSTLPANKALYNAASSFGQEQGESRLRRLLQTDIVRAKAILERINEVVSFLMFFFLSRVNEFPLLSSILNQACRIGPLCRRVLRQIIEHTITLPSAELLASTRSSPRLLADMKQYVTILLNNQNKRIGAQFSELLAAYLTAALEEHLASVSS